MKTRVRIEVNNYDFVYVVEYYDKSSSIWKVALAWTAEKRDLAIRFAEDIATIPEYCRLATGVIKEFGE